MQNKIFTALLSLILASCSPSKYEAIPAKVIQSIVLKTDGVSATNEIEFRLVISHGSLSEQDNQRGLAHLVEHIAFNDTVKYPNESLIPVLEKSGMSLGIHSNATTHFDKTVYRLSLKDPSEVQLALAIDVLSQWAMHVQFKQSTVDAEKPVIIEEWRGYQPDENSWRRQLFRTEYANSRYLNRLPIGDMKIIESAKAKDLEAFYKRWYQPQNAALIVTGNVDSKQVNKLVDQYFGSWKSTEKPTKVDYALSTKAIPKVNVISDDTFDGSFVAINYYLKQPRAKTADELYKATTAKAALDILEQRLKASIQNTQGAVSSISTSPYYLSADTLKVEILANLSGGDVETGLELLTSQLNQLLKQGISQAELDGWRETLMKRTRLHQERSSDLANMAVDNFVYGSPLLRHAEWSAMLEKRLPALTVKQVNEAVLGQLNKQQAKLLVVHNPSITPPDQKALLAFVDNIEVAKAPVVVAKSNSTAEQAWDITPETTGELVKTKRFDNGLVEWTFGNNTRVVFKQNNNEPGKVSYVLSDDHGMEYLSEEQSLHARLALETIGGSGLRNMSGPELAQWLERKGIMHRPFYSFFNKGVQGRAATEDIVTAMNLLHVTLTEARVSPAARFHFLEQNKQTLKQLANSNAKPWQDKVSNLLYQGDAALRIMTKAELEGTNVADMETLYKQMFSGAQRYYLSVVGDISEEALLDAALSTIATLPKSELTDTQPRDFPRISQPEVAKIAGSGQKAAVVSHKLTLDKTALKGVKFKDLSYMSNWLRSSLLAELREKQGLVYSVAVLVEGRLPAQKDYTLTIQFSCDPEKVDELLAALEKVLKEQVETTAQAEQVAGWVSERKAQLKESLGRQGPLASELSSVAMKGIPLDKVLDVDYRATLTDPSALNRSLSALLSDKAIPTTLIWMP